MIPVIVLEGVKKSFGKKQVLRGVTGAIEAGKVVGLLGRNGEGKTTLMRIMLDILAADSGNVSVLSRTPDGSAAIRQLVGYVPERPVYHEFMTVEEVFHLRAGFFPKWDWAKVRETAKKLDLEPGTRVQGASKGTLAKIAWICATAHHPEVLLLDEPTSGLDVVVRESLLSHFVKELSQSQKTVLVTNHHMEELLGILDEVWLMAGGRIQASYSIEELQSHAYRVAGRLKKKTSLPGPIGLFEEHRIGDLVRWLIIDKEALYKIRELDLLDQMEIESLPLEITLKVLLSKIAAPVS